MSRLLPAAAIAASFVLLGQRAPEDTVREHFEHARELLGKHRYERAIDQFLYVLALAPNHHEAHFLTGLAYIQRGLTGLEQADHHLSRAGGFGSTNSLMLELGLGEAWRIDEMEIRWPGGNRRILRDIGANQRIEIVEGKPGFRPLP